MDQHVNSWNDGVADAAGGALTAAQDGMDVVARTVQERPLLFLGLGLAAVAACVAWLNARRLLAEPQRRAPVRRSGARASGAHRTARARKTPAHAA